MPLPTRVLGKTGIPLPILGFGTAQAGKRLTHREAVHLFEAALNAGVQYFDTAPEFAGYGKAQERLGHLLKRRRREVFLVTKCYVPTYDGTLKLLERSLKELQTDYADLVFVHSLGADKMDPAVVFGRQGAYAGLVKAKKMGLTKLIGLSGHNRPGRFVDAIQRFEVDALLNVVNFADRHTYNFEEQVWTVANRLNLGLIAMKVFGGAQKSGAMGLSHCLMPLPHLDLAFRYALSEPLVTCAVIGMATPRELQDNLRRARTFSPLNAREGKNLMKVGHALASQWGTHFGSLV
jgi:predicted aldo/keto reductase-like oxidoreductase